MYTQWMARLYEPVMGRLLSDLRAQVLALCPEQGLVLDCCCGPGGFLRFMGQRPSLQGLGLDMNASMLGEARRLNPHAFLLYGDASALPFQDKALDVATICLALHTMPLATAQAVLPELRRVARTVIVADFCLAERNMALPATWLAHGVEWLAGGEHYRCYRAFMARGGLEGLLHQAGMPVHSRRTVLGGAVRIAVL